MRNWLKRSLPLSRCLASMASPPPRLIAIIGATGTGKSEVRIPPNTSL